MDGAQTESMTGSPANVTLDMVAQNEYLYDGVPVDRSSSTGRDGDSHICAVASSQFSGMTIMTGYLYNAEGIRVAKGTITAWSCDPAVNGFQTTNDYILGLGGEQVTESGVGAASGGTTTSGLVWQHTNVWAGGKLLATYDDDGRTTGGGPHFYFDDPLGTRRVTTNSAGNVEQQCSSLPYGDGETCGTTPTEHLFTGKERDTESGNDYFGARYYASSMGRFLSPDWSAEAEPVPYAKLDNPQSLNLYAYVFNNPLSSIDADGHSGVEPDPDWLQKEKNSEMGRGHNTNAQLAPQQDARKTYAKLENEKFKACVKDRVKPPSVGSTIKGVAKDTLKGTLKELPKAINGQKPSAADMGTQATNAVNDGMQAGFNKILEANAACIVQHPFAVFDPGYNGAFNPGTWTRGVDLIQFFQPSPELQSDKK